MNHTAQEDGEADTTTTISTDDRADRILAAGTTSYTVNANGNLTNRGSDVFAYDQANRLTSATVNGVTSTDVYDGDGKRASQTVGTGTTNYVDDVNNSLPNVLTDGTFKYVYGLGLAYAVDGSGNVQVYHTDGLGSVRAITNGSGTLIQTYQTDEFGIPTSSQGTSTQPFGYTGEQYDIASGLYFLRARMYDSTTGRLLSRDIIGGSTILPASLNRYSYAQNNPVNLSDPSGLCTDPGGPGIRYCIETFIPQQSIWGFQGDGRGPDSSGGSYRTQQLIYQTSGGTTVESHKTGLSVFETPMGEGTRPGDTWFCGAGKSKVLGGRDLFASCAASDGLFYGYAPPAAYTILLEETARGVRIIDARGTRFPSIEVWQYGGAQAPQLVYYYDSQAAGTGPLDLLNKGSLLTR